MRCAGFEVSQEQLARGTTSVDTLVEQLVQTNVAYLRAHPETPPLYRSGVVYREEPLGQECFDTVAGVLQRRHGDCDDLAAWRAAELRVAGYHQARAFSTRGVDHLGVVYHVLVQTPWGVEDPSRVLGMR